MSATRTEHRPERIFSQAVRSAAGEQGTPYPIKIIDGFSAPELTGRSYYHANKSGQIIRYPSAYRRAYGNPIYHSSTHAIQVGAGWLIENNLA